MIRKQPVGRPRKPTPGGRPPKPIGAKPGGGKTIGTPERRSGKVVMTPEKRAQINNLKKRLAGGKPMRRSK